MFLVVPSFYLGSHLTRNRDLIELPKGDTFFLNHYSNIANPVTLDNDSYIGARFNPEDFGLYDDFVLYLIESMWGSATYEITLYVCRDDNGQPDLSNPVFADTYRPDVYPETDYHNINDISFGYENILWIVYYCDMNDAFPMVDDDGNSGFSWQDNGTPDNDWVIGIWIEEYEPSRILSTKSLGIIKASFR